MLDKLKYTKILSSQSDLDIKDKPLVEMQDWCLRQGDIVCMNSGLILTIDPYSRSVQNCKILLNQKNLLSDKPLKVVKAAQTLIDVLLADAQASATAMALMMNENTQVSSQQQRLRALVKEALNVQASDIHIEVRHEVAKIRFRKHGELYLYAQWQAVLGREIASVAFNKETDHAISHFNPTVPQNASMPLEVDGLKIRLRLASIPAHGGFDMVLRVLTTGDDKKQSLAELGYMPDQIALIQKAVQMPSGAIIVSGPTGSGKTTTLASCMNLIEPHRKIYTIEDPVEKFIPQATQIPVNIEKEDRDFAMMGKAALRMDPDVMVLGEMRDEETARVMLRASMTGHLVFSTLHTNSATAIIGRLVDMGISRVWLSDPQLLVCLISQRLLPLLCEKCKVLLKNGFYLRNVETKCHACLGSGIGSRTVIAEIIWVDDEGRKFIQTGDMLGWEHYLRNRHWKNYQARAIDLVKQGLADPYDVEKLTGVTLSN